MQFQTGADPRTILPMSRSSNNAGCTSRRCAWPTTFGCDAIGIQYQQGLKDICAASDLAEGLLNNVDRPPVKERGREANPIRESIALPHFNEVDECAGLDALITNRAWRTLGIAPETTLHDVRYGECFSVEGREEFVWLLEIWAENYVRAVKEFFGGQIDLDPWPKPVFDCRGGNRIHAA